MTENNTNSNPATTNTSLRQNILNTLLYQGVKSLLNLQYQTLEKIVTQKMLLLLNSQTLKLDKMHDSL